MIIYVNKCSDQAELLVQYTHTTHEHIYILYM